jgi:hypothetical protein
MKFEVEFFRCCGVFWSNRVEIEIHMHQEATRPPPPPKWPLRGGVKVENRIFIIP